jgi:C4-dicarboxylate-specific signal transduction histidine kinase
MRSMGEPGPLPDVADPDAPPTAILLALAQFSAGVAHDLNNQLTGVLGFSAVLARILAADPALIHLVELRSAAERAAALAREMQAFGRRPSVHRHPTGLDLLVGGLLDGARHRLNGGPSLRYVPGDQMTAVADPTLLTQGLLDLLPQLALATASDGVLELTLAEVGDERRVRITVRPAAITADALLKRMLPFAEHRSVHGSGLGLAAAWMSLHHAGGRVRIHDLDGALAVDVLFAGSP